MNQPPQYGAPGAAPPPAGPGPPGMGYPPAGPGAPPLAPPPKKSGSTAVIVIIVVIFGVLSVCGVFAGIGVYGFNRYMERAKAARMPDAGPIGIGSPERTAGAGSAPSASSAPGARMVRSKDGHSEIARPDGWQEISELNVDATIQIGSKVQDEYLMVISESKEDFAAGMTLKRFADVSSSQMKGKMKGVTATAYKSLTVQGQPALQFELQGSVDLLNITYLITFIDGQWGYHQILAWTRKSRYASSQTRFVEAANTFREVTTTP